jgi:hypothetical protein
MLRRLPLDRVLSIMTSFFEVFNMTQPAALFEAPVAHATQYSNPYSNPEFEDEWETSHEATHYSNPYSNPEWETSHEATHYSNPYSNPEWETSHEATHYSNPYSNPEWETSHEATHYSNPYSNPEFEDEWETSPSAQYSNPYSNPEFEDEWEASQETHYSNPYSNPEDEGEYFFKSKFFRKIGRGLTKLAKIAAPFVVKGLTSMIPGVGVIAAPFAGKLTRALLREGEMEAEQMEAEFFGANEAETEVASTEVAHEAALTEFLAAQAAEASTEAEAEAHIGATLPLTITIAGGMRGRSAVRPVMPVLSQATGVLAKSLIQQGPNGRQLLRLVPTIQRRTMTTLKALSRSGQPINSATAVKAMAAATQRVLNNPTLVQKAIDRNVVLRQRTAPPSPRRTAATNTHRCPTCATPVRTLRR